MSDVVDTQRVGFTFIWKIEIFSLLTKLLKSKKICGPVFTADNLDRTCWQLELATPGYYDSNKDNILIRFSKILARGPSSISMDYELSILSNDNSKVKSVAESGFLFKDSSSCQTSLNIRPGEIFGKTEILPGDTLTIQCNMWHSEKLSLEPGFSLALTRINAERKAFTWTIDKFSTLQFNDQKTVCVELRPLLKLSFKMTLYLTGIPTYEEKIRIKVEGNNEGTYYKTVLGISIQNVNGKAVYHSEDELELSKGKKEWNFPLVLDKKQLLSNKELFLPDDVLSLKCFLIVSKGDVVLNEIERTTYGPDAKRDLGTALVNTIELPYLGKEVDLSSNSLTNDMRHLFEGKQRADVSLRVKNETFPVHKTILVARSAVFETMFDTDMKEKIASTVEIEDFEPDTIRRLLLYIYSDTFEDIPWENASTLYLAADKYAVLGLKERCSSLLKKDLNITNVCDILVVADMMKDEELKNYALSFILGNDTVMNSPEWKRFAEKHSQLAVEILTCLYKNAKLGCC